jgi:hypothetical protein
VVRGVNDLVESDLNHAQVLLDTLLEQVLHSSATALSCQSRHIRPPSTGWCRRIAR